MYKLPFGCRQAADASHCLLLLSGGEIKVHAPRKKRNATVTLCLIVRNETLYMDEWVDFHIALGFAPIFICGNSLAPDMELESWQERRKDIQQYVKITHTPQSSVQRATYERCIRQDMINNTSTALIDVDGFLDSNNHKDVIDFMEQRCNEDCAQSHSVGK